MKKIKYSSSDFSPLLLPQKRSEVLKDVYKNRFGLIIKCGLLLILFALPLIISLTALDYSRFGTNGYDEKQLEAFYFYWNIFTHIAGIIGLFILLVGVSGVMRILKLLIWQEGIDFWYDFKMGVKENFKPMLIPSLILAAIYIVYYCIFTFAVTSVLSYVSLGFIVIIFAPLYFWYLLLANMYKAGTKDYLNNSLFYYGRTIGWSLLGTALLIWPLFINYFNIPFMLLTFLLKPIIIILLFLFYYPFLIIVLLLYSCHHFDKHINQENYPEYYRKGLFNSESLIDEEEDLYN